MEINVIVNGETRTFDAEPGQNLVSVLRENGYTEVRTGCDTGSCGLCTVWIDGKPTLSCSTLAMRVNGKKNHNNKRGRKNGASLGRAPYS